MRFRLRLIEWRLNRLIRLRDHARAEVSYMERRVELVQSLKQDEDLRLKLKEEAMRAKLRRNEEEEKRKQERVSRAPSQSSTEGSSVFKLLRKYTADLVVGLIGASLYSKLSHLEFDKILETWSTLSDYWIHSLKKDLSFSSENFKIIQETFLSTPSDPAPPGFRVAGYSRGELQVSEELIASRCIAPEGRVYRPFQFSGPGVLKCSELESVILKNIGVHFKNCCPEAALSIPGLMTVEFVRYGDLVRNHDELLNSLIYPPPAILLPGASRGQTHVLDGLLTICGAPCLGTASYLILVPLDGRVYRPLNFFCPFLRHSEVLWNLCEPKVVVIHGGIRNLATDRPGRPSATDLAECLGYLRSLKVPIVILGQGLSSYSNKEEEVDQRLPQRLRN